MAKRFKFRLQPLLRVREQMEELRKRRLGEAVSKRDGMLDDLERLKGEETRAVSEMHDAKTGKVDLVQVRFLNRYINGLHLTRRQHQGDLKAVETEISRRRQELVAASRERKIVDKLKDKRIDEHRAEEAKEEQFQLDEAAQSMDRRKQGKAPGGRKS